MASTRPAYAAATTLPVEPKRRPRDHPGWALVGWILLCALTGGLGGLSAASSLRTWYLHLAKPPYTPPDWVFAPVWTVLYVAIGVAAWLAWKTRNSDCRRRGLRLFLVQLFLNFSWTYIFFGAHHPGAALFEIALLAISIGLTANTFFKMTRTAGWLMTAYLAWVLFAAYLNWGIWRLNN